MSPTHAAHCPDRDKVFACNPQTRLHLAGDRYRALPEVLTCRCARLSSRTQQQTAYLLVGKVPPSHPGAVWCHVWEGNWPCGQMSPRGVPPWRQGGGCGDAESALGVLQLVHNQRTRPERAQDRSHSRRDRAETDAPKRLGQRDFGAPLTHATCMEHYLTWTNMTYGRTSGISRVLHACILS